MHPVFVEMLHYNGTEQPLRSFAFDPHRKGIQLPLGLEVDIAPVAGNPSTMQLLEETLRGLNAGIEHNGIGVARLQNFAKIPQEIILANSTPNQTT